MDQFASVYLDDLIVFSITWEVYLAHLRAVLNKLTEVGLMTKPLKCQLAMAECTYLGHVVGNSVVKLEASKLQAIKSFPQLEIKKASSFIFWANWLLLSLYSKLWYCCSVAD